MESYDVAVIGGGAAGTAAAVAAASAGARVVLMSRGPGATGLAGGGWYDAPPEPFRAALADAGLELVSCAGPLPHPDGHVRTAAAAPQSHAAAALTPATSVLVCGIAGLPAFHASALATLWTAAAGLPRDALVADMVRLEDTPPAGWSPVALAALLSREPDRLAVPLAGAFARSGAQRIVLPAIVGLLDHDPVRAAIERTVGASVGEALGVAPSVPGWRLIHALRRMTDAAGVREFTGRVSARDLSGDRIQLVAADASATVEIDARAVVLATGKYLGGGITADEEFEEPALNCDVAFQRFARTIDDPGAALILTDPERSEPQPVLAAGVRTDALSRPLTPAGGIFHAGVFVAGSARAGVETTVLGLGPAAAEGWAAGERAAAHAAG